MRIYINQQLEGKTNPKNRKKKKKEKKRKKQLKKKWKKENAKNLSSDVYVWQGLSWVECSRGEILLGSVSMFRTHTVSVGKGHSGILR